MKKYMQRLRLFSTVLVCLLAAQLAGAGTAKAEATVKEFQTIIRVIGFLESPALPKTPRMAIIYNPNDSKSSSEAHRIQDIAAGQSKLQTFFVPVSDMSRLQDAHFAFVTSGLGTHYPKISQTLSRSKLLGFTLDRACLDQNCCAVYINAERRVQIIINKAVTEAAEARFKSVFLMMTTVI